MTSNQDLLERPKIDMRPLKPPRKTKAYILDLIPPLGCPDYMAMNHKFMGIPKPPEGLLKHPYKV